MAKRSESEYLYYSDVELRILLSIADKGSLSRASLSKETEIKPSNLTPVIKRLLSRGVLKSKEPREEKQRDRGRPSNELDLESPQIIHDICIELEYRKECYEREIDKHVSILYEKMLTEYWEIADDEKKVDDFMNNRFLPILRERLILGAGTTNTFKEISYPSVRYWLTQLRSKSEKIPKSNSQECSRLLNAPTPDRLMPWSNSLDQMRKEKFRFSCRGTDLFRRGHGLPTSSNQEADGTK